MSSRKHNHITGVIIDKATANSAIAIASETQPSKELSDAAKKAKTILQKAVSQDSGTFVALPKDTIGTLWTGEEKSFIYDNVEHTLHHIGYDPTATPKTQMWRLYAEDNPEQEMVSYVATQCLHVN